MEVGEVLLPGVTIGDYVIIGANAVVTTDIPAKSVAAGIPRSRDQHLRADWRLSAAPHER